MNIRRTARPAALLLAAMLLLPCVSACTPGAESLPTEAPTDPPASPATEAPTEAETFDPLFPPYDTPEEWVLTDSLPEVIHAFPKEDAPKKSVTYSYAADSMDFMVTRGKASGSTVTLENNTVSFINGSHSFDDGTKAVYQADVQIDSKINSGWNALYFGLRLSSADNDATSQSGVWISLQKNQIGMRVGDWPATSYIGKLPDGLDFSASAHHLVIEDDMETDVITVTCADEGTEPVLLATVKIEDGRINMYAPGADKPKLSDPIKGSVNGSGYFRVWLHHMDGPAVVSDLTMTGQTSVKPVEAKANMMNSRDVFADTWVGTDDEGRLTAAGTGAVNDKKVGIFYFLWHDTTDPNGSNPLFDHTKTYYDGGLDALHEVMTQGNLGFAHYWAEPYFGYYRSNDEWVIRKHTMQLTAAGVDFWFIDATNGLTYENNYETILKVWSKMRAEGYKTPQICFHCGNNDDVAPRSFYALWNNLYSVGRYEEFWFLQDGKPLIFMPKKLLKSLDKETQDFFTVRQSWANTNDAWYKGAHGRSCWPWADMYPQKPGLDASGNVEQMIVMSGFWVNGSYGTNAGRSYHDGKQPSIDKSQMGFDLVDAGESGKGYAFEEQFDYAIGVDPGVIMVVGWNEWWAGRWEAGAALGQTIANSYTVVDDNTWKRNYFVDNFNPEYSRDVEPVKGLYNDNYYYQLAQNIRQFKGARAVEAAFGRRPIDMTGSVGQWYSVGPEFRDYTGDTARRDSWSYVGSFHYVNKSGRNDFGTMKVSRYGDDVWFYAECADDVTAAEGSNWMNLFIDADLDAKTGWYGYDYVINRDRDGSTCSVMRFRDDSWSMEEVGRAEYVVSGKVIQIHVTASLLGLGETFDFKWADNSVDDGDVMKFLDQGDTAPNDRFNYRYTITEQTEAVPSCLDADMIVLKAGSYNAYAGGRSVMLDKTNTKAVFLGDGTHLYVPAAFASGVIGLDVSATEVYDRYGVQYVDAASALAASGKVVSVSTDGSLVVIGSREVSEDEMLALYRSLH
ncbi:MAG: hypothetical protein MJ192_03490 [Clostridia bacterium]|nr:hypothetical protein [Clostridia bacterium]